MSNLFATSALSPSFLLIFSGIRTLRCYGDCRVNILRGYRCNSTPQHRAARLHGALLGALHVAPRSFTMRRDNIAICIIAFAQRLGLIANNEMLRVVGGALIQHRAMARSDGFMYQKLLIL